ncbi:hypothetical protein [Streptomyces sp. NPDC056987]|uniref:hypothetical protein n=1 Tax=Streptomyces sp. NPDC056987 TaxID=3345988 RepID=UPI003634B5C9
MAVTLAIAGTLPATPAYTAASAMVLAAVGMGVYAPSLTVLSLTHSPPGRQGHASSAMQTGAAFGLLLAPCALAVPLAARTAPR